MIAHAHSKPPTKAEAARIKRMLALGCICCAMAGIRTQAEGHHIVEGNRRLGHAYMLPLCAGHHRGAWTGSEPGPRVSLASGSKRFAATWGSERSLWERVQKLLGLAAEWPRSKILPRRVA